MQLDNVASPNAPGFAELGIAPQPLEILLPRMVSGDGSGGELSG